MKKFFVLSLVLAFGLALTGASCTVTDTTPTVDTTPKTTLTLVKDTFSPVDEIAVTYNVVENLKDGAWMGIVPSDTPHGLEEDGDAADIDYKYLNGVASGTLRFSAPTEEDDYDFRIYDTDGAGGIELGYVSFTIIEADEE